MKAIFILLSGLFFCDSSAGQIVNNILFIKGAELEYQTFSSRPKGFTKLEMYEVSRITLIVTDVKDSNGVRYSYITKKAKSIKKPEECHYEKNYVVILENNRIKIPKDIYSVDTGYLADRYPQLKKGKGWHAVMQTKDISYYIIDGDSAKDLFSYSSSTEEINVKSREFTMQEQQPGDENYFGGTLRTTKYSMTVTFTGIKNEGKSSVDIKAGKFECYKLLATAKLKIKGAGLMNTNINRETISVVYLDPAIGILKTEDPDENNKTGYIELMRVKK